MSWTSLNPLVSIGSSIALEPNLLEVLIRSCPLDFLSDWILYLHRINNCLGLSTIPCSIASLFVLWLAIDYCWKYKHYA